MSFRSPRATCDSLFDAKMRLRSSYQTLRRSTWRRRWRSETGASNSSHFESHAVSKQLCRNTRRRRWRSEKVASNSSHFESHAVSKHVATTLTSGAPGRKNVETTAAVGVPRIFSGVGGSGRRPVSSVSCARFGYLPQTHHGQANVSTGHQTHELCYGFDHRSHPSRCGRASSPTTQNRFPSDACHLYHFEAWVLRSISCRPFA